MTKQTILWAAALMILTSASIVVEPHPIVGKWLHSRRLNDGKLELMANFRADQTYDGYINNKVFVTGTYWVKNDTLGISDASCNASYYGTYKLSFRNDSVFLAAIQDTCRSRYQGTNGLGFARLERTLKK